MLVVEEQFEVPLYASSNGSFHEASNCVASCISQKRCNLLPPVIADHHGVARVHSGLVSISNAQLHGDPSINKDSYLEGPVYTHAGLERSAMSYFFPDTCV